MKLFSKYNRINLLFTVVIFILGSVAFSFLLRYVIISQVDEDLRIEKNEIIAAINRFHHLPAIIEVHDQYISYKAIPPQPHHINTIHTKTRYDAIDKEEELIRTIAFDVQADGKWYLVSVSKSLEGTDNLIQTIILITLALILLILAASFIINRIVLRRLWQPFYTTLQAMQQFKLSDANSITLGSSNIEEFELLNTTLNNALRKAQQDYQTLKEFTENASHELQTPLAVIRSKLDILIQNEQLSKNESVAIQGAYNAVQNLSRLNQLMLLLAKIENRQFNEHTTIALQPLVQDKINQFKELWQSRHIVLTTKDANSVIYGNIQLIDILLNNLLSNATRHNIAGGFIAICLEPNTLTISNAGIPAALDERQVFSRFHKAVVAGEHHGLGLSIIRQICEVSGYSCAYQFEQPRVHTFVIKW